MKLFIEIWAFIYTVIESGSCWSLISHFVEQNSVEQTSVICLVHSPSLPRQSRVTSDRNM